MSNTCTWICQSSQTDGLVINQLHYTWMGAWDLSLLWKLDMKIYVLILICRLTSARNGGDQRSQMFHYCVVESAMHSAVCVRLGISRGCYVRAKLGGSFHVRIKAIKTARCSRVSLSLTCILGCRGSCSPGEFSQLTALSGLFTCTLT